MNEKEVRNRGDAVGFVPDDINMAVPVAVLAVGLERRGHELSEPHGARKGARDGNRLDLLQPAEFKEVRELGEVVLGAPRVVEGKRHQGVEHAKAPHVAPEDRFDADDCRNGIARNAGFSFHPVENGTVVFEKVSSPANAFAVDEVSFVKEKVLFGRRLFVGVGPRRGVLL